MAPLSGTESERKPLQQRGWRGQPAPEAPEPGLRGSVPRPDSSCVLVPGSRQPQMGPGMWGVLRSLHYCSQVCPAPAHQVPLHRAV